MNNGPLTFRWHSQAVGDFSVSMTPLNTDHFITLDDRTVNHNLESFQDDKTESSFPSSSLSYESSFFRAWPLFLPPCSVTGTFDEKKEQILLM